MVIPVELKDEYPFQSNFLTLSNGQKMHYLDEGKDNKETVIMVHGNPTWSFYYRNVIKNLRKKFRVVSFDHIGCGLSSKPQEYDYILKNHIENAYELLSFLNISTANFIVHDWGGAIGFGLIGLKNIEAKKIVILNTAAFRSDYIAPSINFCRIPFVGEKLIRTFNAFAGLATIRAVENKMPKKIKKGYLLPYQNYQTRIATARFVTDIPMNKKHRSYETLENIEKSLKKINCPKLILWGKKDFCFNDYFLNKWESIYPEAKVVEYQKAGHYVLEDEPQKTIEEIGEFF